MSTVLISYKNIYINIVCRLYVFCIDIVVRNGTSEKDLSSSNEHASVRSEGNKEASVESKCLSYLDVAKKGVEEGMSGNR